MWTNSRLFFGRRFGYTNCSATLTMKKRDSRSQGKEIGTKIQDGDMNKVRT